MTNRIVVKPKKPFFSNKSLAFVGKEHGSESIKLALFYQWEMASGYRMHLTVLTATQKRPQHQRSTTKALCQPFTTTTFAKRAFRCSAPAVWNSLPQTVLSNDSVVVFKSKLKKFLFSQAFSSFSAHYHAAWSQRLWSYDLMALYKSVHYYYYYYYYT